MSQKGFAGLIILISVVALSTAAAGGFYYYKSNIAKKPDIQTPGSPTPEPSESEFVSLPLDEVTKSAQLSPSPSAFPITASSGMKTLSAKSCQISLDYPESWNVETYEEGTACIISIGQTKPKHIQFHFTGNGSSRINLDSIRKTDARDLTVDSATGFIQPSGTVDNISAEVFYLNKIKVLFIGQISFETGDTESAEIARKIIASIKFTSDNSFYSGETVVNFNNHIQEAVYDKTNAKLLKTILEKYRSDTGKLPDRLTDLNNTPYAELWSAGRKGTDEYTDLEYLNLGSTFTVTATLPNDFKFTVEGGGN